MFEGDLAGCLIGVGGCLLVCSLKCFLGTSFACLLSAPLGTNAKSSVYLYIYAELQCCLRSRLLSHERYKRCIGRSPTLTVMTHIIYVIILHTAFSYSSIFDNLATALKILCNMYYVLLSMYCLYYHHHCCYSRPNKSIMRKPNSS